MKTMKTMKTMKRYSSLPIEMILNKTDNNRYILETESIKGMKEYCGNKEEMIFLIRKICKIHHFTRENFHKVLDTFELVENSLLIIY